MNKRILHLAIVLIVVLVWAACNRIFDVNDQDRPLEYVSFTDHGCRGHDLGKADSSAPYLLKHQTASGILTLTVHYSANCCPAFTDSVSIHENTVDITFDDTLRACKCVCEYDNDFAFTYSGSDWVRVRFGGRGGPFELDTLIQLP
jgi:hypothetical protein